MPRAGACAIDMSVMPLVGLLPAPLAVDENGDLGAVGADAHDVHVVGANHEVHVRARRVDAVLAQILGRHIVATLIALGKTDAQRQVTAGVLVVQCIEEQQLGLANGRVFGNERDLAQAAGALVGVQDAFEHVAAHDRIEVDHAAALEAQPELIHAVAVVDKRQRRVHDALDALAIRRGENLLGGDVGEERMAVGRLAATARPQMAIGEADGEVRSVIGGAVQCGEAALVQEAQVLLEGRVMQIPVALGIRAVGARRGKDRPPQAIDGDLVGHTGEHMARPRRHRGARDAPGVDVEVQTAAEDAALGVARFGGCRGLCRVDALQGLGVRALHEDEARAVLGERIELQALPFGRLLEVGGLDVFVGEARNRVVRPDDCHMAGAGGVRLAHKHVHKGV